jgi:uncharacterized protein
VLGVLGVLGAAGAAVLGYAFLVEPRRVEVRRVRIHVRDLPAALEGLRIGLLTDLHAIDDRSLKLVRRAADLAMEASPALVAITGDLIGRGAESFRPVLDALAALRPPLGVYAVPGNHDHSLGLERWRVELGEASPIVDLTNRSIVLPIDGSRLCLAGVDDLIRGRASLASLPHPRERDVTILLAHNPDQAEAVRRAYDRVDLVVSGHTHGGQIRLPGIGPLLSSVDNPDLYEQGLRRRPWTQVYTSRGIGTVHVRARLFARPEVSILELTGAPRPSRAGPLDRLFPALLRPTAARSG